MRENTVERVRPQMATWRMRVACWIPKATNTHSDYVTLIAFPLQQWLHEHASMLRHTYNGCSCSIFRLMYYTNKHYDGSLVNLNMNQRYKLIYFISRTNIYQ